LPIGYVKAPVKAVVRDETGARALNTDYQNTLGRPIIAIVTCTCDRNALNDGALMQALVGSPLPLGAGDMVSQAGLLGVGQITEEMHCLVFAVPNQDFYRVNAALINTGTVTLDHWIEVEL